MNPLFDVFQSEANGTVLWVGAAATLEQAQEMLQGAEPGEYFVVNLTTKARFAVSVASLAPSA